MLKASERWTIADGTRPECVNGSNWSQTEQSKASVETARPPTESPAQCIQCTPGSQVGAKQCLLPTLWRHMQQHSAV